MYTPPSWLPMSLAPARHLRTPEPDVRMRGLLSTTPRPLPSHLAMPIAPLLH